MLRRRGLPARGRKDTDNQRIGLDNPGDCLFSFTERIGVAELFARRHAGRAVGEKLLDTPCAAAVGTDHDGTAILLEVPGPGYGAPALA